MPFRNGTVAKSTIERQCIAEGFNGDPEAVKKLLYDVVICNQIAYDGIDLQTRTCAILGAYVMHSRRCVCLYDLRTLFGELVDKAAQELCKQDEFELDDEEMLRYCPTDTHKSPWRFDAHTSPWRD